MDYFMKVLLFLFTIVAAGLNHSRVGETTQDVSIKAPNSTWPQFPREASLL